MQAFSSGAQMFCLRTKAHVETPKEGRKWFLLSLIFLRNNKDSGYNSANINKQLSRAQNTPALQANLSHDHKHLYRAWEVFLGIRVGDVQPGSTNLDNTVSNQNSIHARFQT